MTATATPTLRERTASDAVEVRAVGDRLYVCLPPMVKPSEHDISRLRSVGFSWQQHDPVLAQQGIARGCWAALYTPRSIAMAQSVAHTDEVAVAATKLKQGERGNAFIFANLDGEGLTICVPFDPDPIAVDALWDSGFRKVGTQDGARACWRASYTPERHAVVRDWLGANHPVVLKIDHEAATLDTMQVEEIDIAGLVDVSIKPLPKLDGAKGSQYLILLEAVDPSLNGGFRFVGEKIEFGQHEMLPGSYILHAYAGTRTRANGKPLRAARLVRVNQQGGLDVLADVEAFDKPGQDEIIKVFAAAADGMNVPTIETDDGEVLPTSRRKSGVELPLPKSLIGVDIAAELKGIIEREEASILRTLENHKQLLPGFFPTPTQVVETMLELAQIQEGHWVLEPSAGMGHIAARIRALYPKSRKFRVEVIEPVEELRRLLDLKGFPLVATDFLSYKEVYDRIVMNPPFEIGQDIEHVLHAYNHLTPNGRVVAVMGRASLTNTDDKSRQWQAFLAEHLGTTRTGLLGDVKRSKGGELRHLPASTFSRGERTANVETILLVLNKPNVGERPEARKPLLTQPVRTEAKLKVIREREDLREDERAQLTGVAENVSASTRALLMRGRDHGIKQDVIDGQIEDVGLIVNAMAREKPLFLLANEAGTGKTFVLAAAVKELRERTGFSEFLIVTMNQALIRQFKRDMAPYGLDGVEFATYTTIRNEKKPISAEGRVLVFDESHNIKNVDTAQGERGKALMEEAAFTILSSATPFENPVECEYLGATGLFDTDGLGGFEQWALAYGAAVRNTKTRDEGGYVTRKTQLLWPRGAAVTPEVERDAMKARIWIEKQGILTQRSKTLDPDLVQATFEKVDVTPYWQKLFDDLDLVETLGIDIAGDLMADDERETSSTTDPSRRAKGDVKRYMMGVKKRVLEAAKLEAAIEATRKELAQGKQVVIFTETKAARVLGMARLSTTYRQKLRIKDSDPRNRLYSASEMMRELNEWNVRAQQAREQARLGGGRVKLPPAPFAPATVGVAAAFESITGVTTLPAIPDELVDALGENNVGFYTGSVSDAQANIAKDAFLAGELPVLIATMAKGGTGLSLHDTDGDKPRTQIQINLPWSARQVEQVAGRTMRYGLMSRAESKWLFAGNIGFERELAALVGGKLSSMAATVKGIELPAGRELVSFDFEGSYDATATVTDAVTPLRKLPSLAEMTGQASNTTNNRPKPPSLGVPSEVTVSDVSRVPVGAATEEGDIVIARDLTQEQAERAAQAKGARAAKVKGKGEKSWGVIGEQGTDGLHAAAAQSSTHSASNTLAPDGEQTLVEDAVGYAQLIRALGLDGRLHQAKRQSKTFKGRSGKAALQCITHRDWLQLVLKRSGSGQVLCEVTLIFDSRGVIQAVEEVISA